MSKDFQDRQEIGPSEKNKFWRAHIGAWEQSGISQVEYCRNKMLPLKSFGYWKNKFCSKKSPVTFVPVAGKRMPLPTVQPGTSLKLLTRSGHGIEIGDGFNPDTLRKVLKTLSGEV